jgi:hypothetical protein
MPNPMPNPAAAPANALDALRASNQWLKLLVEEMDVDPETTAVVVSAVSADGGRKLAELTLAEQIAANDAILFGIVA